MVMTLNIKKVICIILSSSAGAKRCSVGSIKIRFYKRYRFSKALAQFVGDFGGKRNQFFKRFFLDEKRKKYETICKFFCGKKNVQRINFLNVLVIL